MGRDLLIWIGMTSQRENPFGNQYKYYPFSHASRVRSEKPDASLIILPAAQKLSTAASSIHNNSLIDEHWVSDFNISTCRLSLSLD